MSLKFTEESCVMTMKNDAFILHGMNQLTCHFKINIRSLMNFNLSNQKSQKFAL